VEDRTWLNLKDFGIQIGESLNSMLQDFSTIFLVSGKNIGSSWKFRHRCILDKEASVTFRKTSQFVVRIQSRFALWCGGTCPLTSDVELPVHMCDSVVIWLISGENCYHAAENTYAWHKADWLIVLLHIGDGPGWDSISDNRYKVNGTDDCLKLVYVSLDAISLFHRLEHVISFNLRH